MRSQAVPAIRVRQVRPPYAAIQELDRRGDGLARGSVLVLDIPGPVQAIESEIEAVVSDLRRRHSVSLALRLPDPDGSQPLWFVVWAYRLGIRAFLPPDGRVGEALQQWLAHPLDLAGDWLDWVRLRHPVSRESAWYIARIVDEAWRFVLLTRDLPERAGLAAFFEHLRVSERTARYHLAKDGLPGPERWFAGARLLHAQLALQRDPALKVTVVTRMLGYSEPLSFSNRVCRVFGATIPTARKLLGVEWRFERWWSWATGGRSPGGRSRRRRPA